MGSTVIRVKTGIKSGKTKSGIKSGKTKTSETKQEVQKPVEYNWGSGNKLGSK